MHHRDFFFALAGTVSQGDSYDTRYNAMDILIRASAGLDDLDAIDQRFDQLIVARYKRRSRTTSSIFRIGS